MQSRVAGLWRWVRAPFWLGLGLALGFGGPYLWQLDRLVRTRFAELSWAQPSRVYARALQLAPGIALSPEALERDLAASRYRAVEQPLQPGTYARAGNRFEIATRAFRGAPGSQPARRLAVTLGDGRVRTLQDAVTGRPLREAWIDPARIATLYGSRQEERRVVRLAEVPPLLVAGLQAVEDRDFKHHRGVDPWAIVRAAWANLVAGEVVQGGSTLTQQLVRNLFLDRTQSWARKINEALLALLIEARFDKARILEAYLNEVYLGQQGAQAVHGVGAAAEFWFGRELGTLGLAESALLIGLIQGPSLHDPRRWPERAAARRAVVLKAMQDTGVITAHDRALATQAPLGVVAEGALPKNRYPAFLDLVREQVRRDFPDTRLRQEGFAIHTTLAPPAQHWAEAAVAERLDALGERGAGLQAALVLTRRADGAVEALVGGRDADEPGFNRATRAARPIGSLVKPFVYLVALAQPNGWSLASPLQDRALQLTLPNGSTWAPANVDQQEHGEVLLIDALARSFNLATVHLGLELGVAKVERVLEALIPGADISPHPSLLLGATELSPLQVAQAYQYLAADGRPQPLYAVAAVLDAEGRPLSRYRAEPRAGELVAAARLVGYALQETARSGTAHALVGLGLGHLRAAGKTGTSNDQRDSWFAGWTGGHLAVAWLGSDDNRGTGLFGSTGALRVWARLFAKLPSEPLTIPLDDDPRLAWIDPGLQRAVDPGCPGARALPFIRGYEPIGVYGCGDGRDAWSDEDWDDYRRVESADRGPVDAPRERRRFRDWFRRDEVD